MDKQKFDYGEFHWGKGGFAALLLDFAVLFRQCDHQRTASQQVPAQEEQSPQKHGELCGSLGTLDLCEVSYPQVDRAQAKGSRRSRRQRNHTDEETHRRMPPENKGKQHETTNKANHQPTPPRHRSEAHTHRG